jgi:hypothetical protein
MFDYTFAIPNTLSVNNFNFYDRIRYIISKSNCLNFFETKKEDDLEFKIVFKNESDRSSFLEELQKQIGKQ